MGNKLLYALTNTIEFAATLYIFMIFTRAVMTWLRTDVIYRYKKFFDFIIKMTDPLVLFCVKNLPVRAGAFDLTPVVAILVVEAVKVLLIFALRAMLGS
ncbi:MAG: YggT family protein [Spirochaetia bacterium]|nr:YggT family protein [Spirochaetia bacterium]